jgi:hypothetical protein
MTISRILPRTLSGIVETMELYLPQVITLPMLKEYADQCGLELESDSELRRIAYWLQDLGWLSSLRSRGAWEFIPGSRAGAFSSGDRLIEYRAQGLLNPKWPGVLAMESSASLLGLSQHIPDQDVIDLPTGYRKPKALSTWRVVHLEIPNQGCSTIDSVRTWNTSGLLAGIAQRPTSYRDLAGLAQWLPEIPELIDFKILKSCLENSPVSVWQRTAYLLVQAGATQMAEELLVIKKPNSMIWYGSSRKDGKYDPLSKVNDADLIKYLGEVPR